MNTILLIEDEEDTRSIFVECLQEEGFNIIEAKDGKSGLQLLQNKLPELVICDIVMPQLNGYDVLIKLRQNPKTKKLPFIFLTAKSTDSEKCYGLELGADGYLTKPCTVEDLLKAITQVL